MVLGLLCFSRLSHVDVRRVPKRCWGFLTSGCPEMYGCRSLGAQMALGLFDSPEHVDMQRVPKQ